MTKTKMLIMLTVLIATGTAGAQSDSLRCEARQMRAESQYYGCLARCDRRAERNAARPAERQTAATQDDCEATCTAHYDDDLARILGGPPCITVPPEPNPQQCEAHMLRVASSHLRCQARCNRDPQREGFDRTACLAACETRCDTAHDEVAARAVCAAGRVGTEEICVTH